MKLNLFFPLCACLIALAGCASSDDAPESSSFKLTLLDRYNSGVFDESAAEISAFDPSSKRLFVVNGHSKAIDVLDLNDPSNITKLGSIDVTAVDSNAGGANSVAVKNGIVAVAIENSDKQANGFVGLYTANASLSSITPISVLTAGALPDMLTFTPDGNRILVANEGEPNDTYDNDPDGSITVIDIRNGAQFATASQVGFTDWNGQEIVLNSIGVRIFGPGASASQDFEPEYIAVSSDSKTAYVALQENNAIAVVNLVSVPKVERIFPLGFKDHSLTINELDSNDKDDIALLAPQPVLGMYQPDSIAYYEVDGQGYIVTANEGDSRDYDGYSEEERVKDLTLDATAFPSAAILQSNDIIGRMKTTTATGDLDNDNDHDQIYVYGARSFSIFKASDMTLVFDSGSDFESITAAELGADFNSSNDETPSGDSRSDDKGPEPEALALTTHNGKTYALIGLERAGGVMVYDISNPNGVVFEAYQQDRDFSVPFDNAASYSEAVGDLGPEGIIVVSPNDSPNGNSLVIIANEVSGTVAVYQLTE